MSCNCWSNKERSPFGISTFLSNKALWTSMDRNNQKTSFWTLPPAWSASHRTKLINSFIVVNRPSCSKKVLAELTEESKKKLPNIITGWLKTGIRCSGLIDQKSKLLIHGTELFSLLITWKDGSTVWDSQSVWWYGAVLVRGLLS